MVFGSLIENRVRDFVAHAVSPLSVSSGSLSGVPAEHQLDVLVWDHQVAPPVVEHGDVVVVAPTSVCGVLEVKASGDLGKFAARMESIRDDLNILRSGDPVANEVQVPVLGLLVYDTQEYDRVRLGSEDTLTVLFHDDGNGNYAPNVMGVRDFVGFVYNRVLPASRAMRALAAERIRAENMNRGGVW